MLRPTMPRTSGVETPEFPEQLGAAEGVLKERLRPFPQGLKPDASQTLNVGAKAPTP